MSYILDALRKLERDRKKGRIPGLVEQDTIVYHSAKRPAWQYLLIAGVAFGSAISGWLLLPDRTKEKYVANAPAPVQEYRPQYRPQPDVLPAVQPETAPRTDRPGPAAPAAAPAEKPMAAATGDILKKAAPAREIRETKMTAEPKKAEPAVAEPKTVITEAPVPEKSLYRFSELPMSVRNGLPGFSITAFMYSETPSSRMVRINDRMMHEGQELEPGIRLEEIAPDGVILSYRKFRFIVGVK